jgi:hypothetical protein
VTLNGHCVPDGSETGPPEFFLRAVSFGPIWQRSEDWGRPIFCLPGVLGQSPRTPRLHIKMCVSTLFLRQRSLPGTDGDAADGSGRLKFKCNFDSSHSWRGT